jgi:DNA-binding CsgD family transcriptional regulator
MSIFDTKTKYITCTRCNTTRNPDVSIQCPICKKYRKNDAFPREMNKYIISKNILITLINRKMSADEISKKLNIGKNTVYRRMKEFNLYDIKSKQFFPFTKFELEEELKEKTQAQIAKEINRSQDTIRYYKNKWNL